MNKYNRVIFRVRYKVAREATRWCRKFISTDTLHRIVGMNVSGYNSSYLIGIKAILRILRCRIFQTKNRCRDNARCEFLLLSGRVIPLIHRCWFFL